jgi:hypothetical protein
VLRPGVKPMPKSEVKGDAKFEFGLTLGVEIVPVLYCIREPILVCVRKIFVLARTVQKHRNHLLSAPASCKFFALECAS